MKTLKFDLMRPIGGGSERFIQTMNYPFNPLFKFDFDELYKWIIGKRPTLKGQAISCHLYDEGKTVLYFNCKMRDI